VSKQEKKFTPDELRKHLAVKLSDAELEAAAGGDGIHRYYAHCWTCRKHINTEPVSGGEAMSFLYLHLAEYPSHFVEIVE